MVDQPCCGSGLVTDALRKAAEPQCGEQGCLMAPWPPDSYSCAAARRIAAVFMSEPRFYNTSYGIFLLYSWLSCSLPYFCSFRVFYQQS